MDLHHDSAVYHRSAHSSQQASSSRHSLRGSFLRFPLQLHTRLIREQPPPQGQAPAGVYCTAKGSAMDAGALGLVSTRAPSLHNAADSLAMSKQGILTTRLKRTLQPWLTAIHLASKTDYPIKGSQQFRTVHGSLTPVLCHVIMFMPMICRVVALPLATNQIIPKSFIIQTQKNVPPRHSRLASSVPTYPRHWPPLLCVHLLRIQPCLKIQQAPRLGSFCSSLAQAKCHKRPWLTPSPLSFTKHLGKWYNSISQ